MAKLPATMNENFLILAVFGSLRKSFPVKIVYPEKAMQFIFILVVILFFCAMLAYSSDLKQREQDRIRTSLERQGKEIIQLTTKTSSNGKGSPNIYEVTYRTTDNELYKVQCICWRQGELFWTEPALVRQVITRSDQPMEQAVLVGIDISAENSPLNKEIIINGLTSGAAQERVAMAQQIGALSEVDELVTYILMDISRDDPAAAVREAAAETLRLLEIREAAIVA